MFFSGVEVGKRPVAGVLLAVVFLLSTLGVIVLLAACDSGTPTVPATSGTPGVSTGQRVFSEYCNSCHPGGNRGAGVALKPLLPTLSDDEIGTIVRHGKRPMPGYNQNAISDVELASLISYLRTLK